MTWFLFAALISAPAGSRRTREGEQPGRIRREMRSPEQEHRIRERIRDRRRER